MATRKPKRKFAMVNPPAIYISHSVDEDERGSTLSSQYTFKHTPVLSRQKAIDCTENSVKQQTQLLGVEQTEFIRSYSSPGSTENIHRSRLNSFKSFLREMSPKIGKRKKSLQPQWSVSSDQLNDGDPEFKGAKLNRRKFSLQLDSRPNLLGKASISAIDLEDGMRYHYTKRPSLSALLDKAHTNHLKKTSLFSSMRNLFHTHKSLSHSKLQCETADGLDDSKFFSDCEKMSMKWQRRKLTTPSHKRLKGILFLDTLSSTEGSYCLLTYNLIVADTQIYQLDIEVQRLDLSEVNADISRLKHAESTDQISQMVLDFLYNHLQDNSDDTSDTVVSDSEVPRNIQMDDHVMLSRIEKLFPHDDLELNSSSGKKPRRRRSAPSQILLKNFRRSATVEDNSKLNDQSDYVSRKFIFESPVQLTAGLQTQERYLFLFNDVLFIAKQRSATSYKLKNRVLVGELWISDNVTEVSETTNLNSAKSFVIGWPTTNFVASFSSKELCDRWREKLISQIEEEQQKEPSSITVEVVSKNSEQDTSKLTLKIERQTSAKDLLIKALLSFDFKTVKEPADYQLWLFSTKDNSVYPLFGHEQPFAIQLSHERDAEETDPNIKCQFILRETKKQMKQLDRKTQKSKKKKLAGISGIFRKSSGKLTALPLSHSFSDGKLFGCPLDEICDPNLPKPLMELLEHLYNIGPFTTEIFRKPANARKCHEMVMHMNSTQPEGWTAGCRNGILLASVLKTFLKELPGTLCCSKIYNQWVEAISIDNDCERTLKIKEIVEKLPQGNQLLLKHTICILYHIADRSDENLMTSSNLGICLGPSLLWSDTSDSSEETAKISKAVPSIITYLIDNCQSIFGDDILNLFGHPPKQPMDSDTDEQEPSDRIRTPYNDSLESLSDNEANAMNSLTQMSPSSCSRDSGLILSDPHEDAGEHSDDHSLRQQQLGRSKSCDSLTQSEPRTLSSCLVPLQTQVSSDSLDCDDEYIELGSHFRGLLLTKSQSGAHLCFEKEAARQPVPNERLKDRLAKISNRYKEGSPSLPEMGYASSDSDKSETNTEQKKEVEFWTGNDLQKSSTNSSLQRGSSSSDDAISASFDNVTHRHIDVPKFLESSENGHQPTDFLKQFTQKIKTEEENKKKLQQIMRERTDPSTQSSQNGSHDQMNTSAHAATAHRNNHNHRHAKRMANGNVKTASPRISRTNTYAGRSDRRHKHSDTIMVANKAETRPIMPQQYRPSRPPSYNEACERNELLKSGTSVSEIEKIKQTVNSARAKQLYAKSLQIFEQENNVPASEYRSQQRRMSTDECDSIASSNSNPRTQALSSLQNNNNTIGVIQTSNKKIVLKRAPTKISSSHDASSSMFYQPTSSLSTKLTSSSSNNNLASSFYRPTQPPPYKEATQTKSSKPDLIDSLGSESLV